MKGVDEMAIRMMRVALPIVIVALVASFNQPGQAAVPRDTLVYVKDISDTISLDPAVVYEFSGVEVAQNVYDTLVQFEGEDLTTPKPRLATSWTIQDAGASWKLTFKLRPGVKFSTGRPLTAKAVAFSFDRAIALNKSPAFLFREIAGMKEGDTKALSDDTVEVTLPKTASPQAFLSILTFTVAGIVDPDEALARQSGSDRGEAWLRNHSAGAGPYVVERWDPDSQMVMVANPNYWGKKPALSRIIIRHIAESSNQKFLLENGDADIASNLTPEQARDAATKPNLKVQIGKSLQLVYMAMNIGQKPLDNVRVREAIRSAIDYDGIVRDLLRGTGKKIQTIIPEGLFGYNSNTPFQADPARAKNLLSEAGVPNGFSVELMVPTGPAPGGVKWSDIGAKIQSDLAKIGIKVELREIAQAQLLAIYRAQRAQMTLILWGPDFPDPDGNVGPFTDYGANSIAFRNLYKDDRLAQLGRQAAVERDAAKRKEMYRDLTERVLHQGPYVVLYQPTIPFGLQKSVTGFVWSPSGWADFSKVAK